MIKSQKRNSIFQLIAVLCALILLCVGNVVYAYFSSTGAVKGNGNLTDFDVRFAYLANSSVNVASSNILTVYPMASTGPISRGDSFKISVNGATEIQSLMINISENSSSAHVRLRIDAYKYNSNSSTVDTSTNYGQYFDFTSTLSNLAREIKTTTECTNAIYFVTTSLIADAVHVFANGMKLLTTAPVSMLNSEIKIIITFDAVQSENMAYKSVFDDEWGYYSGW